MTKEEFIAIAQQSRNRVEMLSKMGHPYTFENLVTHIKTPRQSFGMTKQEMFSYFLEPTITKDAYLSHLSGSKNRREMLEKMGQTVSEENYIVYVMDPGEKYGISSDELKSTLVKNRSTGSLAP